MNPSLIMWDGIPFVPMAFNEVISKSCELLERPEYNNLQHSEKQVRKN